MGIENAPHRSQWIRAKGNLATLVLEVKGNLFCLAIGQMSQWAILLHCTKGTTLFKRSSLPLEGCRKRKCHISGWVQID